MNISFSNNSSGNKSIFFIFSLLAGASMIAFALKKLKLRRHIENIATSRIKSAAINELVELNCQVIKDRSHHIYSPLSNVLCNSYIWRFERLVQDEDGSEWRHMFDFYSQDFLLVEDEGDRTNQAAVQMDQSKIENLDPYKVVKFDNRTYKLPPKVLEILHSHKLFDVEKKAFFLFSTDYRLKEFLFYPEQSLFIIGTTFFPDTMKGKEIINSEKKRFGKNNDRKVSSLKWTKFMKDKKVLKVFDKNNDGIIDEEEEKEIIKKLNENYKKYAPQKESKYDLSKIKFIMGKSESRTQFFDDPDVLISGESEKKLSSQLLAEGISYLLIGSSMVTFGIYQLVKKLFF